MDQNMSNIEVGAPGGGGIGLQTDVRAGKKRYHMRKTQTTSFNTCEALREA